MISLGHSSLAAFLLVLSWHLGLSMELPIVAWLGSGLALLAALRLVTVERPTAGLTFVLFATGALTGNQVLEDWAMEDSWPQDNGFGAGIMISLLLYLIWRFAAKDMNEAGRAIDRDSQAILVWGMLSLLLITPGEAAVTLLFGERASLLALAGMALACVVLLAERVGPALLPRLLMLAPVVLVVPLMNGGLAAGQAPLVAAIGNIMPSGRDFTPTGFSPYQTLRPSVFLRPSNDPVMRIRSAGLPNRYMVGNRLVSLNSELVWLPSERTVQSYSSFDAQLLDSDQWRYAIDNHNFTGDNATRQSLSVSSLKGDDFLFIPPDTTHISGRFSAISRNAADVLTPNFERGADPRWELETGTATGPDRVNPETLGLPEFWDEELQAHSAGFAADNRQATADNIVTYFLGRDYTLQTDFDPQQPFHDFYLNDKAGYCFWFASATTLALRANGIPSRLVGGYLVHEQLNEELYLVRERDAHSWVEWQDEDGYWHTVDPTPASIAAFFGGYDSPPLSQWYHRLAGQWQAFVDAVLDNQFAATAITWGGLGVLVFLFAREYRRIRTRREAGTDTARRWRRLWQRFLKTTGLPEQPSWTAAAYAANLPQDWDEQRRASAQRFLEIYGQYRFGKPEPADVEALEQTLKSI